MDHLFVFEIRYGLESSFGEEMCMWHWKRKEESMEVKHILIIAMENGWWIFIAFYWYFCSIENMREI
jgi:hypothetical protein